MSDTCTCCGTPRDISCEPDEEHIWGIGAADCRAILPKSPDRMWAEAGALYAEAIREANGMRRRAYGHAAFRQRLEAA